MANISFYKVNALPSILTPSSLYFVKALDRNTVSIYLTDKSGQIIYRSPDSTDVSTIITAIINALKGQPGGLAALDNNGDVIQSAVSVLAIDGQIGQWLSNSNLVWFTKTQTLFASGSTATDPIQILLFGNMQGLLFPPNALTQVFSQIQIPSDIALNTDMYINIHWMPGSNGNGNVRLGLEYSVSKSYDQSVFPETTIVYASKAANSTVDFLRNQTTEILQLNSSDIEPDSTLNMRVFRDGANVADTFKANISLWKISLKYQRARIGTRNRSPSFY